MLAQSFNFSAKSRHLSRHPTNAMYPLAILFSQSFGQCSFSHHSIQKFNAAVNQFGLIVPAAHVCPPPAFRDHYVIKVKYTLSKATVASPSVHSPYRVRVLAPWGRLGRRSSECCWVLFIVIRIVHQHQHKRGLCM
jgi:hypothetical protein